MSRKPPLPTILIVADDLTGALDSAVAFAGAGRRVVLARGVGWIEQAMARDPDVLAINTASREGTVAEAERAIAMLAEAMPLADVPTILKKVDSRMKGHVGAEVAALARATGRRRIVAVPAIPDMGRVQAGGYLTGRAIDGPVDLARLLGPGVEIPDAEDDAALDRIVSGNEVSGGGADTLWVGARGLAFALARHLGVDGGLGGKALVPPLPGPALFAIGSRDPVTRAQVAALDLPVVAAPDGAVPDTPPSEDFEVVAMTEGGTGRAAARAGADFADGIAARLVARRALTLLASGGETAEAILDRLDVGCLDVMAEIAPGLPVSIATVPWGRMRVLTKSGGFGPPDLLRRLARRAGPTMARTEGS